MNKNSAHDDRSGLADRLWAGPDAAPAVIVEPPADNLVTGRPCAGAGDALHAIQNMFGTDFAELAGFFEADSPKRIGALRTAARARDVVTIAVAAPALSASSASMGANGLAAAPG